MIKRILCLFLSGLGLMAGAQVPDAPQMADTMRSDGKIYVVISVIGLIFLALVVFLVYIERKVKKLEEDLNTNKH